MKNIIAIIPARSGSKGIKDKNIKYLGNKPLINWTIDKALKCSNIQDILVTTPDISLLNHLNDQYKKKIICRKRDVGLARINQQLFPTLFDALDIYTNKNNIPDVVMVLNIEAPFLSEMYMDKAVNIMRLYNIDSVIATRLDDDLFFIHDGTGLKSRLANNSLRLERDNLYRKVGGLTLVKTDFLKKQKKLFGGKVGHIQIDKKAALMIRDEFDWLLAETLIKK